MPRHLALLAGIAVVLALSACSPAVPPTTGPTIAPTAGASAAPTATPAPDVAPLLATRLASIRSSEQHLAGTLRAGDVLATFEGDLSINGPDQSSTLSITVGGSTTTEQHVKVAGARYVQGGSGPWLVDTAASSSGDLATALKTALTSVTDLDVNSPNAAAHHLESKVQDFNPVAFGFAPIGQAAGGIATYAFVARTDGTPQSVRIEATWKQAQGSATVDAALDLTIEFRELDNQPRIVPPADVWVVYESADDRYSIAHPADFDHARQSGADYFFGPDSTHVAYVSREKLAAGATLNLVATAELKSLKKLLAAKSGSNEAVLIDGTAGRLLSVTGTNKGYAGKAISQEALVVKGKYIYLIGFLAPAGNEAVDQATMAALIATFRAV